MIQYTQYFGRFNDFRGQIGGLPSWARTIVGIVALPGLVLLALSIVAVVVIVLALLLLTVPVYTLLRRLTAPRVTGAPGTPGVRRVEATIIE
jgi:hypothetical protein